VLKSIWLRKEKNLLYNYSLVSNVSRHVMLPACVTVYSFPWYTTGMHKPWAGSGPWMCYIRPSEQVKKTRKFFWMTKILWMNLKLIELLTILQPITIWNGSDGNNIKPQAIKRLVRYKKSVFNTRLSKVQLVILTTALECTKNNTLRPLAQRGCAPLVYNVSNVYWIRLMYTG